MLESFESCSASVTIQMPLQKHRPLTSSTSLIFIKWSAISIAIWHTQTVILQHNRYFLYALTNKPLKSISEHRLLERGKGKEESRLEMNKHIIISLFSVSYHHLHILLEASAVCSGTVDLAKMLFLCYGCKPKMEIWPLLIKQSWSISDIKVYILFIIQQTWRHSFASEETALQFDVLQTSLPDHKNLALKTQRWKVKIYKSAFLTGMIHVTAAILYYQFPNFCLW